MSDPVLVISKDPGPFQAVLGPGILHAAALKEGWALLEGSRPALLILDWDLADAKASAFCEKMRAHPALKLTLLLVLVDKARPGDKEKGFAAKADACLGRPFDPRELRLWAAALLRRVQRSEQAGGVLRAEDFSMDPQARTVTAGDRVIRDLTDKEFSLLYELVRRRPKVVSKESLMRALGSSVVRDNTVEVHVRNLRLKLGPAAGRVVTVTKAGYRFQ